VVGGRAVEAGLIGGQPDQSRLAPAKPDEATRSMTSMALGNIRYAQWTCNPEFSGGHAVDAGDCCGQGGVQQREPYAYSRQESSAFPGRRSFDAALGPDDVVAAAALIALCHAGGRLPKRIATLIRSPQVRPSRTMKVGARVKSGITPRAARAPVDFDQEPFPAIAARSRGVEQERAQSRDEPCKAPGFVGKRWIRRDPEG
jgi:hypothetical protein